MARIYGWVVLNRYLDKSYKEDLSKLLKRRYIRVLTAINRTNFYIVDGQPVGYEYDLLKSYQVYLNKKRSKKQLPISVEFIPVARDQLLPKLLQGYGDIAAAGLTITPERQKMVAFTKPYLKGIDEVVVTHKRMVPPAEISGLAGWPVWVRKSSSYFQSLQSINSQLKKDGLSPIQIQRVEEGMETETILEMVNNGAFAITIADSHIASAWSEVLPDIRVNNSLKVREGGDIAWAVRKESPELINSLNRFLKSHKKGTLLGNIYFKQYYQSSDRLQDPTDVDSWEKIVKFKHLIKRYADQYQFDWLLILALAFQESGLDHNKRSHVGAVGLMQVLPSTAADSKIGINRVDRLENNIHAGIKYLAHLRDNYFNEDGLEERDRIRFALAAYNAGPSKIRKIRKKAKQMGLSPNKWFRNVEYAALRGIGQETVRYVSNINRYYLLYQSIGEPDTVIQRGE